jgi:hypothetical protein
MEIRRKREQKSLLKQEEVWRKWKKDVQSKYVEALLQSKEPKDDPEGKDDTYAERCVKKFVEVIRADILCKFWRVSYATKGDHAKDHETIIVIEEETNHF